jgi:hypothetical protein
MHKSVNCGVPAVIYDADPCSLTWPSYNPSRMPNGSDTSTILQFAV